jgi:hypothetical protein
VLKNSHHKQHQNVSQLNACTGHVIQCRVFNCCVMLRVSATFVANENVLWHLHSLYICLPFV